MTANTVARYGVVGDPVEHSLSPQIHESFAKQMGDVIDYRRFRVSAEEFARFVRDFAAAGGRGLNVTVPHKGAAQALMDECDPLAAGALAVNTIEVLQDGSAVPHLKGYNTDGLGLVRDIRERFGVTIAGSTILLLGAGGAARGVLFPLLQQDPQMVVIANRTLATAEQLARHCSDHWSGEVAVSSFDALAGQHADIIINATSLGLQGQVPALPASVPVGAFCYDMSYGSSAHFQRWAAQHGAAESVDGLGMLVEQAAESFYIWRGARPQTDPVYAQLRAAL